MTAIADLHASSLLVKNTFYHITVEKEEGSSSRRSSSLPPGFCPSAFEELEEVQANSNNKLTPPFESLELAPAASWADASTDGMDFEDEASTRTVSDSLFGSDTDTEICRNCGDFPTLCSNCGDFSPSPTLASTAASTPTDLPKTPLTSKAAPWQPIQVVQDPLPYTFGKEAAHGITAMKKAVEDSKLAGQVEVESTANGGWYVSVQVTVMSDRNKVIEVAQRALLAAVGDTSVTYVMGYLRTPFISEPDGFRAMLGAMRDETLACWDAYGKGFCRDRSRCGYLHPGSMMPLQVALYA